MSAAQTDPQPMPSSQEVDPTLTLDPERRAANEAGLSFRIGPAEVENAMNTTSASVDFVTVPAEVLLDQEVQPSVDEARKTAVEAMTGGHTEQDAYYELLRSADAVVRIRHYTVGTE